MAETVKRSTKFSGSIGAGMKSVLNPNGREFFILEYKNDSIKFKTGQRQEIIVDYIEIGRDNRCLIQFDESYKTVSRIHAAIIKEGDGWKLLHLSKTNPTLLNGRPVANEWYLQSGDEIQFSVEGPKLVFIIPTNNITGTLGLTRRMSLFRKQALRPYKRALTFLSIFLVLAIGGLIGWNVMRHQVWEEKYAMATDSIDSLKMELDKGIDNLIKIDSINRKLLLNDSLTQIKIKRQQIRFAEMIKEQQKKDSIRLAEMLKTTNVTENNDDLSINVPDVVERYGNAIYYLNMDKIIMIESENEMEQEIFDPSLMTNGIAFLLDNGKVFTARNIVEPWYYFASDDNKSNMFNLNLFDNTVGDVVALFTLTSSSNVIDDVTNQHFMIDKSEDQKGVTSGDHGDYNWERANILGEFNWATINNPNKEVNGNGFKMMKDYSPKIGDKLLYLAYPNGIGSNITGIKPASYEAAVVCNGLYNGLIVTDITKTELNISGSPLLYVDNEGDLYVVGYIIDYMNNVICMPMSSGIN